MQAIEFPDGKLVVRANASRAVLDAWDDVGELAAGALVLLLVVVNALVFWLVGRAVRPFGQIVDALNAAARRAASTSTLPPLAGTEAAAIGAAFNRMVGELQAPHRDRDAAPCAPRLQLSDSRELARWIDHHIEQERRMIARELHDELGQSVTAMRSMALSIAQRVRALDAQAEAGRAPDRRRVLAAVRRDARHHPAPDAAGARQLRPRRGAERPGRAHAAQAHAGVQVDVDIGLGDAPLGSDAALALYRAAQEGITNALRHGQAHAPAARAARVAATP